MIDADRLIEKIDESNAVRAKNELEQLKTTVDQFDCAVMLMKSHLEDIANAAKVLKHWRMLRLPIKVFNGIVAPQRAQFIYDDSDSNKLMGCYATGDIPHVGWNSDGSIQIGCSFRLSTDAVRDGLLKDSKGKVIEGYMISFYRVSTLLIVLARWYDTMEAEFVKYFETLGK